MNKLLIVIVFLFSITNANAQSKKSSAKKANKQKAAYASIGKKRDAKIKQWSDSSYVEDSVRISTDSLGYAILDSERTDFKSRKNSEIDSNAHARNKHFGGEREKQRVEERNNDLLYKSSGLSENQRRQTAVINDEYHQKARAVRDNESLTQDQKKEQLGTLNTERRARLKAFLGKSKEKKLDENSKKYVSKNPGKVSYNW